MPSPTPVVYVFHGPDEPSLKEKLDELISQSTSPASADLNILRLDGRTVTLGEIETAARALPFLAAIRLVLVDNLSESASGRAVIERLPDILPGLPDSTRLIFVETGPHEEEGEGGRRAGGRPQALRKLVNLVDADPRGRVYAFDLPADVARWLQARARRHGAEMEPGAARALAERIGSDLILADSELVKLATYALGRPIAAEDVSLLTPYSAEANIFHMVDALGQRQGHIALRALRRLLDDGDEPLRVFGMITRQYRLLSQMREQLDRGVSASGAAQALGLRDFVARKLAEQARQYRMEHLDRIMEILLDIDVAIKTGRQDGRMALEELVVRLAGKN